MSAGRIRIAFVFLIWLLNCNLTDLSHLLLCVPEQGMCLCFLKCSRLLESGSKSIPGTLLMMIHQTVKIKVGDEMCCVRYEKHFPLTKQNLCFPPAPNLLTVQGLILAASSCCCPRSSMVCCLLAEGSSSLLC